MRSIAGASSPCSGTATRGSACLAISPSSSSGEIVSSAPNTAVNAAAKAIISARVEHSAARSA